MLTTGEIRGAVLAGEGHNPLRDKAERFQDLIEGLQLLQERRPDEFSFSIEKRADDSIRITVEFNEALIVVMDTLEISATDELILNGRNLSRDPLLFTKARDEIVSDLLTAASGRAARCRREGRKVCA